VITAVSVKVKVFVIIISIVTLLTAASTGFAIYFSQLHFMAAVSDDMTMISEITAKMVSANIRLLKAEVDTIAAECLAVAMRDAEAPGSPSGGLPNLLKEETLKRGYLSLAVMDSKGKVASYGTFAPSDGFVRTPYARRAAIGERVVSSTEYAGEGNLVNLVIRVSVPMGSRILVATLPGTYFNNFIAEFKIWRLGNIFIVDREGVMVSSYRTELVTNRFSFIRDALRPE
jgi:hypothetical protein